MIGFGAAQQVVKGFKYPSETAIPMFFEDALHLFGRRIDRVAPGWLLKGHPEHVVTCLGDDLIVIFFDVLFPLRRHVFLHGRQNEVGCALKNSDLRCRFGDVREHLYRRGACANDAYPLTCHVETLGPS